MQRVFVSDEDSRLIDLEAQRDNVSRQVAVNRILATGFICLKAITHFAMRYRIPVAILERTSQGGLGVLNEILTEDQYQAIVSGASGSPFAFGKDHDNYVHDITDLLRPDAPPMLARIGGNLKRIDPQYDGFDNSTNFELCIHINELVEGAFIGTKKIFFARKPSELYFIAGQISE